MYWGLSTRQRRLKSWQKSPMTAGFPMMTKCVFRAGFSWKVIAHKWDGFEAAFEQFSIGRCVMMDDEWLDQLISDKRIVRNGQKIMTVQKNASMIAHYAGFMGKKQSSGFGQFIADWPKFSYQIT